MYLDLLKLKNNYLAMLVVSCPSDTCYVLHKDIWTTDARRYFHAFML